MLGYLAALLIAYGLILLAVRLLEKRIIFFPDYPGRLDGDWHPRALPVQDIWLTTADGVKLHGWWIPNLSAQFTFLAFHGNAGNIAGRAEVYRFLWQLPANVLAVEYRGYGRSEGNPSEAGIYQDAQAGHDYALKTLNVQPDHQLWPIAGDGSCCGLGFEMSRRGSRARGPIRFHPSSDAAYLSLSPGYWLGCKIKI